jgi:hypothetical protein
LSAAFHRTFHLEDNDMKTLLLAAALFAAFSTTASAQNKGGGSTSSGAGMVTIDQAKAEAGGVTAGDAPGFPVHITQPGHYRLTSNLVVSDPNVEAIQITADNVTLDLNGFHIQGGTVCTGVMSNYGCTPSNGSGIGVRSNSRTLVTVRNGSVRGFQVGVWVGAQSRVEDLNIAESRVAGIITASASYVARNVVSGGDYGIQAAGVVRDNAVDNIRSYAMFNMGPATLFLGNSVARAAGPGIWASSTATSIGAAAFNSIVNASGPSIYGGVSLGDGQTNACNAVKC